MKYKRILVADDDPLGAGRTLAAREDFPQAAPVVVAGADGAKPADFDEFQAIGRRRGHVWGEGSESRATSGDATQFSSTLSVAPRLLKMQMLCPEEEPLPATPPPAQRVVSALVGTRVCRRIRAVFWLWVENLFSATAKAFGSLPAGARQPVPTESFTVAA